MADKARELLAFWMQFDFSPIAWRAGDAPRELAILRADTERFLSMRTEYEEKNVRLSTEQRRLVIETHGINEQIEKGHYLNVHFRAFQLAYNAWQEHVRQNAIGGSRAANSPAGAVLDDEPRGGWKDEGR